MSRYETLLKAIADEKRLKLISLLLREKGEFYVCEIADALEESQYNVSKYLKELKMANLVKGRRIGKGILYSTIEPKEDFSRLIFNAILSISDDYTKRERQLLGLRTTMREGDRCVARIKNNHWKETVRSKID
jgi:ArsR family transcriptional regulator